MDAGPARGKWSKSDVAVRCGRPYFTYTASAVVISASALGLHAELDRSVHVRRDALMVYDCQIASVETDYERSWFVRL